LSLQGAVSYTAARFALESLRRTPLSLANSLGATYASVLDRAIPRLRRSGRINIQRALPHAPADQILDGVFASIGRILVALARFPDLNKRNIHDWISYEGFEHYVEAKRRGKGVLFATAHLGNWELSAFAHSLMTEPMHVVVRPLDHPAIDELVEARRQLSGNRLISKRDGARAIFRALAANEAVGILIDQNAALDEGVFVPFFGIPACANAAFAKIAHRTGASIIPGFALWNSAEQRYVLRFEPILETTGDVLEDTARVHAVIERIVREYPDQWLWIHRRWKTRPPGEPAFYP
jgi:Kdo2-lipid IVA lauroyltransferase/acyltransferase